MSRLGTSRSITTRLEGPHAMPMLYGAEDQACPMRLRSLVARSSHPVMAGRLSPGRGEDSPAAVGMARCAA